MNSQIIKLFAFIVVLFGLLIGFTSYWSVFDSESLKAERVNRRTLLEAQQIKRGTIFAADGTVIAKSVGRGKGTSRYYVRRYPTGDQFGHPIGYSFTDKGQSQFEKFHDEELTGQTSEFTSILDQIRGRRKQGDNVYTNIYPSAQTAAFDGLAGRAGSVVAIEPSTGRIRAMVSVPPYDPNTVPEDFALLNKDPASPLLDRSVQAGYPPGSTMKVVTTAAALDTGALTPDSIINGASPIDIEGIPLSNDGGASYGDISLTTALTNSVNTVFAQVGEKLGKETMFEYMDRFGFNQKPQVDLPEDEKLISGVYDGAKRVGPDDPIDIGRVAIGQERLRVTPIQMAEVASAVANGGKLIKPQIWNKVVDPEGRTLNSQEPSTQSQVMKPETAAELNTMMQSVVNEGTGTAAALSGIDVAGKTGTAEVPGSGTCNGLPNQAWFIGFAPANDPKVAVAATVECTDGFGGTIAAPIAKSVMEAVLAAEG